MTAPTTAILLATPSPFERATNTSGIVLSSRCFVCQAYDSGAVGYKTAVKGGSLGPSFLLPLHEGPSRGGGSSRPGSPHFSNLNDLRFEGVTLSYRGALGPHNSTLDCVERKPGRGLRCPFDSPRPGPPSVCLPDPRPPVRTRTYDLRRSPSYSPNDTLSADDPYQEVYDAMLKVDVVTLRRALLRGGARRREEGW